MIWQVGTNGVLRDDGAIATGEIIRAGVERIKAAGADVMIMNPQYAPAMLQHAHYRDMLHVLDAVANAEDVPLFPRFAIMRQWAEEGRMPLNAMLTRDRLHMTDVSYDCLARQIATSIDTIARRNTIETREAGQPKAESAIAQPNKDNKWGMRMVGRDRAAEGHLTLPAAHATTNFA